MDYLDFEPHEWQAHPDDDLAIVALPHVEEHVVNCVMDNMIVTPSKIEKHNFGIGDEIVMIGRYMGHEGTSKNIPTARFGNISKMPVEKWRQPYYENDVDVFFVEMRSLSGYSGSPVFAFKAPYNLANDEVYIVHEFGFGLLGIDCGHISEPTKIEPTIVKVKQASLAPGEKEIQVVSLHTGMNWVAPAWKLFDLLNLEKFKRQREQEEEQALRKKAESPRWAVFDE